jgi:hypothetical protein
MARKRYNPEEIVAKLRHSGLAGPERGGRKRGRGVPRFIRDQRERGSGPKTWNNARTELAPRARAVGQA